MNEIIVTWWGALERGGPTVGDVLSVVNMEKALQLSNLSYTIASDINLDCFEKKTVNWREVEPNRFSIHLFVCGPIIGGSTSFHELIERFDHCTKIAVGVSILPKDSMDYWNPFDLVIARDGLRNNHFDLSLSFPRYTVTEPLKYSSSNNRKLTIGLCLRGKQREYGEENSLHNDAEVIVNNFIQRVGASYLELDTRLDHEDNTFEGFFSTLQDCDIVLTTRLHGLLLALLCQKPVIALDQIRGGGKVMSIAQRLGWSYSYSVEDVTISNLEESLNNILNEVGNENIIKTRQRAIELSISTLETVITSICKVIKRVDCDGNS